VQLLSHQSKISTKIEIFLGFGADYKSATFKRLGFLSLDSNERSSFQARELKTVYVNEVGQFMRLVIHRCYTNKYNLFNQVGVIAVNLLGTEEGFGRGPIAGVPHGGNRFSNPRAGPNSLNDLSVDLNLDPQTASKLRQLAEAKARAIASEDYATAKEIKVAEAELKGLGAKLAELDMSKKRAVESEDYDRASDLKEDIEELRREMAGTVSNIRIPGVADTSYPPTYQQHNQQQHQQQEPLFAEPVEPPPTIVDEREVAGPAKAMPTRAPPRRAAPVNVDDIVVGGGRGGGSGMGGVPEFAEDERAIQPAMDSKNDGYENAFEDDPKPTFTLADEERFAPGEHPLEGAGDVQALPTPEALNKKAKDLATESGISSLLGDYVTRCLFSKQWSLRDAAFAKVKMSLEDGIYGEVSQCGNTVIAVIKVGVEDKMGQVMGSALSLQESLLERGAAERASKSDLAKFEAVIGSLLEKLNDGNTRNRESSMKGLKTLAKAKVVGAPVVCRGALQPLTSKLKSLWRPLQGRLQVLVDLLTAHGLNSLGVSADQIMKFVKDNNGFAHPNGEVREAAKLLTVALQKIVGTPVIDPHLKGLRPKQIEEYYFIFDGGEVPGSNASTRSASTEGMSHRSMGTAKSGGGSNKSGASKPSAKPSANSSDSSSSTGKGSAEGRAASASAEGQEGGEDFTVCMFCGAEDKTWDEDALDLHYWKDCPLLTACPACTQVVEIAGLPEHLCEECEKKDDYIYCNVTGLSIAKSEYKKWSVDPLRKAPPDGSMYCCLCRTAVPDNDDIWRDHLLNHCRANVRSIR
jgi:centrosomal protein CEP104